MSDDQTFCNKLRTGELSMPDNSIGGRFPSQLESLTALQTMTLSSNRFEGNFHEIFRNLTSLGKFVSFDVGTLSSILTPNFKSCVALNIVNLDISNNEFGGSIGSTVSSLVSLGTSHVQYVLTLAFLNLSDIFVYVCRISKSWQ
jgi:hypothetical protein